MRPEPEIDSSTVTTSAGEAVFRGPGLVHAHAQHYEAIRELPPKASIDITLTVSPAGSDLTTEVTCSLLPYGEDSNHKGTWKKS
jgi:hypothetical protein